MKFCLGRLSCLEFGIRILRWLSLITNDDDDIGNARLWQKNLFIMTLLSLYSQVFIVAKYRKYIRRGRYGLCLANDSID